MVGAFCVFKCSFLLVLVVNSRDGYLEKLGKLFIYESMQKTDVWSSADFIYAV